MSVEEARAVMKGVIEVPEDIARLKKEAGRKAIMKVNAMMAQITKSLAEAAQAEAEKKVETELGLRRQTLKEMRALGEELEKKGKEIEEMKAQGKFTKMPPLNIDFWNKVQSLNEKINEQKEGGLNLEINIDV